MAFGPKTPRLPPNCGEDLDKVLLYNPYQNHFQEARRKRFCTICKQIGSMDVNSQFTCPTCKTAHHSNLTAPRVNDRLLILSGRQGGKTLIAAHAAREEMLVPNSIGWVMGPTFKILWDSTFPTLIRLIPPDWVKRWDPEHDELTLKNGAKVAFRSLEDPERARGPHGVAWGWFDEAAQSPERAYDVFTPTLIAAAGIVIASTTVLGYDWTYDRIEKLAAMGEQGYWTAKWWTEENPLFKSNPVMMREIRRAEKAMAPDFYAQEYKAERRNATGLIYDYSQIEKQCLLTSAEVQKFIPEWPAIDPSRPTVVGLDSGADHPFGALRLVATPKGLVAVLEYLERGRATSAHLEPISRALAVAGATDMKWAANKNEANLRLEWALRGVGVIPAENKQEVGIQRVQTWLHSGQLFFAYTVPKTIEQMRAYRRADNTKPSGEKKVKEEVFKLKDELPDALRYALMAWPSLPDVEVAVQTDAQKARWDNLDDRMKADIIRMRDYQAKQTSQDMDETEEGYPLGSMVSSWNEDMIE